MKHTAHAKHMLETETALSLAVCNGHTECVKFLLQHGAGWIYIPFDVNPRLHFTPEIEYLLVAAGCTFPESKKQPEKKELSLQNICKESIRKHLRTKDTVKMDLKNVNTDTLEDLLGKKNQQENLFILVPKLPIPTFIKEYLVNDISLSTLETL